MVLFKADQLANFAGTPLSVVGYRNQASGFDPRSGEEIVERSGRIEPRPSREDLLGIVPTSLTPRTQTETVQTTEKRPVVDHAPRQHSTEAGRE
jgi:hypothetical protein